MSNSSASSSTNTIGVSEEEKLNEFPVYIDKYGAEHTLKMWFAFKGFYGEFFGFEKCVRFKNIWNGWFLSHGDPSSDEWTSVDLTEVMPYIVKGSLTVLPKDLHMLMGPIGFKRKWTPSQK